jgi:hypothetical protein
LIQWSAIRAPEKSHLRRSLKIIDVATIDLRKRPDLIIFGNPLAYSEGGMPLASLVVVEFKRHQRDGCGDELGEV